MLISGGKKVIILDKNKNKYIRKFVFLSYKRTQIIIETKKITIINYLQEGMSETIDKDKVQKKLVLPGRRQTLS